LRYLLSSFCLTSYLQIQEDIEMSMEISQTIKEYWVKLEQIEDYL